MLLLLQAQLHMSGVIAQDGARPSVWQEAAMGEACC